MANTPKYSGKVNAHAYALLIASLSEGPYTRQELADLTGLHEQTVGHYVDELRRVKPKQAYIHQWLDTDSRHKLPAFKLGGYPDARKPRPLTRSEIAKRYKDAQRKKGDSVFDYHGGPIAGYVWKDS